MAAIVAADDDRAINDAYQQATDAMQRLRRHRVDGRLGTIAMIHTSCSTCLEWIRHVRAEDPSIVYTLDDADRQHILDVVERAYPGVVALAERRARENNTDLDRALADVERLRRERGDLREDVASLRDTIDSLREENLRLRAVASRQMPSTPSTTKRRRESSPEDDSMDEGRDAPPRRHGPQPMDQDRPAYAGLPAGVTPVTPGRLPMASKDMERISADLAAAREYWDTTRDEVGYYRRLPLESEEAREAIARALAHIKEHHSMRGLSEHDRVVLERHRSVGKLPPLVAPNGAPGWVLNMYSMFSRAPDLLYEATRDDGDYVFIGDLDINAWARRLQPQFTGPDARSRAITWRQMFWPILANPDFWQDHATSRALLPAPYTPDGYYWLSRDAVSAGRYSGEVPTDAGQVTDEHMTHLANWLVDRGLNETTWGPVNEFARRQLAGLPLNRWTAAIAERRLTGRGAPGGPSSSKKRKFKKAKTSGSAAAAGAASGATTGPTTTTPVVGTLNLAGGSTIDPALLRVPAGRGPIPFPTEGLTRLDYGDEEVPDGGSNDPTSGPSKGKGKAPASPLSEDDDPPQSDVALSKASDVEDEPMGSPSPPPEGKGKGKAVAKPKPSTKKRK